ncbi:UDP-Glycosyltransferase/glycogen phosphorylase [Phlegmacium glaucopus]|nr:UDP-Glycosyltransferase/glycogen phosphorylase [Phlegmacium glaucopus]
MTSTNISHLLLLPFAAWGHIRPFCVLATRIVREQENSVVTFIVVPHLLEKARAEISRQFRDEPSETAKALQRIRILSPCPSNDAEMFDAVKIFADAYPAAYQTLYEAKPITCSVTGTTFDAVPAPSLAILDFFALPQLYATRAVTGRSVPIIACVAAGAGALLRLFGPESMGGLGDIGAKIDAEAARAGVASIDIGEEIFRRTEGKLIRVTGLPAMYDHEFFPQKLPFDKPVHAIVRGGYTFFKECDGVIVTTSSIYDGASLDAMKQWFADTQKEVHVLGPVLPLGYGIESKNSEEGASGDVEAFLEKMLVEHGKRSVFFISFGTIFWPTVPEYVDELIEALIEKKTPFILAHASPFAKISEQQIERVKASGLGLLTTWSPQQYLLNHPATGWFVTHGGFNSITESLGSGIPLICWPCDADQPAAAAHLTENLNVAFELFQVRSGEGLKVIHRNGIVPKGTREAVGIEIRQTLDLCRGEKGQELRRNAEGFKVKFAKAWEEDGIARKELRSLLRKYT